MTKLEAFLQANATLADDTLVRDCVSGGLKLGDLRSLARKVEPTNGVPEGGALGIQVPTGGRHYNSEVLGGGDVFSDPRLGGGGGGAGDPRLGGGGASGGTS
jgi:hypothetical protein